MVNPKAPNQPYGNEYFTGEGITETQNLKGDDSRVIMDRALPFIQRATESKTPFFEVIWFHTPHAPVIGGEKYRAPYADRTENEQHYYACLTAMDEQMGRLRAELATLGIAENTMLWFCSDNGPSMQKESRHAGSTAGLSGAKLSIQEGGIRVPGLMVWPGKIQPRTVDAPCVTSDYFPTILDSLGITPPADLLYDGSSLLPLITGQKTQRDTSIGFLNQEAKESAWMSNRYKLLVTKKGAQLFDLKTDPAEKKNLAKKHPEIHARMKQELTEWKKGVLKELKAVPKEK